MKIKANSKNPQKLVNAINKAIKDDHLKTWRIVHNDKKEVLYSHIPEQWDEKSMLKPFVYDDYVSFVVKWWKKNEEPAEEIQGYILGRFVEVLMVHFKDYFNFLEISKD